MDDLFGRKRLAAGPADEVSGTDGVVSGADDMVIGADNMAAGAADRVRGADGVVSGTGSVVSATDARANGAVHGVRGADNGAKIGVSEPPDLRHAPHADGQPDILIGTHALLHEKNPPPRLGLAVIDEQHKFGVLQRAALSGGRKVAPDVLVMTATPIPRTLAITVYGDLDVSILDELPAGRGKIVTAVRPDSKIHDAAVFIRGHLAAGRQAYLVYPLIEESEKLIAKAATVRFEHWKEVLKPFRCELLHGRMRPDDKDAVMRAFRDGEVNALVSTTVIEVGIDVKNANLMLIENAERFGLAQLHQLRGRIGRGEHKSYCLLMMDARAGADAAAKLKVLEDSAGRVQDRRGRPATARAGEHPRHRAKRIAAPQTRRPAPRRRFDEAGACDGEGVVRERPRLAVAREYALSKIHRRE